MSTGCNEKNQNNQGGEQSSQVYILSALKKTIAVDGEYQLSVVDLPKGTNVTWSVNDTKVASVTENGLVKGLKVGKTKVIARVGNQVLECEITVQVMLEEYLEIVFPNEPDNQISLERGGSYTFAPELSNGDKNVQYTITSSSSSILVSGLKITAISAVSNATITITCNLSDVAPVVFTVTVV